MFQRCVFLQKLMSCGLVLSAAAAVLCAQYSFAKGAAAPAVVDQMVEVYARGCDLGPWSTEALETSASLTSLLESLQDKTNCKGIERSIHSAQALNDDLRRLLVVDAFRAERNSQDALAELLVSLEDPTLLPEARQELVETYARRRAEAPIVRARLSSAQALTEADVISGMDRVSSYLRTLLSEQSALWRCYADNPAVAYRVSANLGSLAGSFAPAMVGAGLEALASVTQMAIGAIQNAPIANEIRRTRSSRMPLALRCGLQAMTRQYCQAKDAHALGNLWVDAGRSPNQDPHPFFKGLVFLERDLPVIDRWLDRVVSGTQFRDADQARKVGVFARRVFNSVILRRENQAMFLQLEDELRRIGNDENQRVSAIRAKCREFIARAFSNPNEGPFFSDNDGIALASELIGTEYDTQTDSFDIYISKYVTRSDQLEDILKNSDVIFDRRTRRVAAEFGANSNVDSGSLVRQATRSSLREPSVLEGFKRLLGFFSGYAYGEGFERSQDEQLIRELETRVEVLATALADPLVTSEERVVLPDGTVVGSRADQLIASVFESFKLINTNVYFGERVRRLVETDLVHRIRRGESPKSLDDILLQAGGDVSNTLLRVGVETPYQLQSDTEEAMAVVSGSLSSFRSFFANAIDQAILSESKRADEQRQPTFVELRERLSRAPGALAEAADAIAPERFNVARLCLLTLYSGMEWPSRATGSGSSWHRCKDAFLLSRDSGQWLTFSSENERLKTSPFTERVCGYHDFLRKDSLFRFQRDWRSLTKTVLK